MKRKIITYTILKLCLLFCLISVGCVFEPAEEWIKQLKDEDWRVRRDAAVKLGNIGNKKAVDPLIASLKDEYSEVRKAIAETLGKLGDPKATETLIACLKDEHSDVRKTAADALDKLGYKPALQDEQIVYFIAKQEWDELVKIGNPAVESLITLLKDRDSDVRKAAAHSLDKLGYKPASQDEQITYFVAKQEWDELIKIGKPAVEHLITYLRDENSDVRKAVAETLDKIDYRPTFQHEQIIYLIAKQDWNKLIKIGKPAAEYLITCLKDENSDVRKAAVETLAKIGKPALESLITCLKEEDWNVCNTAAEAFVKIGKPAVKPLIACLKDKNPKVREVAAEVLVKIGKPAVNQLIVCLKDKNPKVRTVVAETLGKIGDPKAVKHLRACLKDDDWNVREAATKALIKVSSPKEIEHLIASLMDEDLFLYITIAEALDEIKDEKAVESLINCLKDKNPAVRAVAAIALGEIGDQKALDTLIVCLKDENSYVRMAAAEALGIIGNPETLKPLKDCLKDENLDVRKTVAEALDKLEYKPDSQDEQIAYLIAKQNWDELVKIGKPAVESLIALLKEHNSPVRKAAAETLDKIGYKPNSQDEQIAYLIAKQDWNELLKIGQPALEHLKDCLKDENLDVRKAAAETLDKIGYKPVSQDEQIAYLIAKEDWNELVKIGKPAAEYLIACLKDEKTEIRAVAAEVLGKISDKKAVKPLIERLKDENWYVRKVAAKALGKIGDKKAVKPLIARLKDNNSEVLEAIAESLMKIGKPAVEHLIACLKDEKTEVRAVAAEVLGEIGDKKAVNPLIACLKDENPDVRIAAAGALIKIGDPKAIKPLIVFLESEAWEAHEEFVDIIIGLEFTKALVDMGKPAVESLIACLKDKNLNLRKVAAEALGEIGDKKAVPYLLSALPDWHAQSSIGEALEKLGYTPKNEVEQVYLWICKKDGKKLKANWEQTKRVLLNDLQSGNRKKVENAVYTFISLGKEKVADELIKILDTKGDIVMAEVYFRCGNERLKRAAEKWASRHGYSTMPSLGDLPGPVWGSW